MKKKEPNNKSNYKKHIEIHYNDGFIAKDPFSPKKAADRPKTYKPINREDH